ncbi:hypothetical protein BDW75DRAFT_199260 [Aspergillus navahoensis]
MRCQKSRREVESSSSSSSATSSLEQHLHSRRQKGPFHHYLVFLRLTIFFFPIIEVLHHHCLPSLQKASTQTIPPTPTKTS